MKIIKTIASVALLCLVGLPCFGTEAVADNPFTPVLRAVPAAELPAKVAGQSCRRNPGVGKVGCPCVADDRVFGIVSELLAESWCRAAANWAPDDTLALRFDARVPAPAEPPQPKWWMRLPIPGLQEVRY